MDLRVVEKIVKPLSCAPAFGELLTEAQTLGQFTENVVVVSRLTHRFDCLVGVQQVIGIRKYDVLPFEEGGYR